MKIKYIHKVKYQNIAEYKKLTYFYTVNGYVYLIKLEDDELVKFTVDEIINLGFSIRKTDLEYTNLFLKQLKNISNKGLYFSLLNRSQPDGWDGCFTKLGEVILYEVRNEFEKRLSNWLEN